MASINYATREISCKIVYYGPGLSGKTTNLQIIHRKIPDKDKSEMVSLATETDRTLFFDFLPLDLGSIKGFSTKFQLYTVPGQVYYNATRKLVLRGVDGVVFVVDSQVDKLQENLESFANLQENLREYGHSIENIPMVLQYNKRDLPNVYPIDQLNSLINKHRLQYFEAVAATGVGVFTTLKGIGKSVIDKFNAKYAGFQGASRRTRAAEPAPPPNSSPAPVPPSAPPQPQAQNPFPSPKPPADMPRSPISMPSPAQPFPQAPQFGGAAPNPGFRQPANPQAPSFGGAQPPFGGAAPGAPGFGNAPGPAANPFSGGQGGFPPPPVFPGQNPGPQSAPFASPGFGAPASNPFAGTGPGNPPSFTPPPGMGGPAKPGFPGGGPTGGGFPNLQSNPQPGFPPAGPGPQGNMPGTGAPSPFPFASPKPAFPPENKPSGNQPWMPGQPGMNQGSGSAQGNIPVSPFVESFSGAKPTFPGAPGGNPGMPPLGNNPFGGPTGNPGPGGPGSAKPFPPMPAPGPGGQGPGMQGPGGQGPGGMGQGGFPAMGNPGMPNPAQPGQFASFPNNFGGPMGAGGNPGQTPPNPGAAFGQGKPTPAFPSMPGNPSQDDSPQGGMHPGQGSGGNEDNSGIVTTYEDMAKDDSFKTRKLPHPNEKKKGFFDGLFKKEK